MNKLLLSICIPTYNREHCLKDCLNSIVSQFDNPDIFNQVEVVISDNASADSTEQMVKEFQKEFPNIFYYKNPENIGVDRNILNVVEKAKGEFIWFLGDDDALFPDALGYMMEELKSRKFEYCWVNCFGYDKNLKNPALKLPNLAVKSNRYFKTLGDCVKKWNKNNLVGCFCSLSTQVFKRQIWQDWPRKEEYIGSNTIHARILILSMKERGFAIIAKPLVKTRSANIRWDTFPGSETLSKRVRSTYEFLFWIFDEYKVPYSKTVLKFEQKKDFFISWATNVLKKYLFRSQKSRDLIKKILGKL